MFFLIFYCFSLVFPRFFLFSDDTMYLCCHGLDVHKFSEQNCGERAEHRGQIKERSGKRIEIQGLSFLLNSFLINPMNGLNKKQIKKLMWSFWDLDFRFQTWESGSGGDFLRRFRIWGQNLRIQASRGQKLGETISKMNLLICFSLFPLFFNPFTGLTWGVMNRR